MTSIASDQAIKIGDLLIRSGLFTVEQLEEAVKVADKMHLTLQRVMEMNAWLNERAFNAAVGLSERVERQDLPLATALKVFDLVSKQNIDVDTAERQLTRVVPKIDRSQHSSKLGELLVAAGLIYPPHLNLGLHNSLNTSLPLGMVLLDMELVSRPMLESALTAQRMMVEQQLTRDQAVQALRAARLRSTSFEQSLKDHGFPLKTLDKPFGVGELLALSSVITETQLLAAREVALDQERPLEDVLKAWGMASPLLLSASRHLIGMVQNGMIFEDQAATILRKLRKARSHEEATNIMNNFQLELQSEEELVDLVELLKQSGLVREADVAAATPISLQHRAPLLKVLVDAGLLEAKTVELAVQCKHFIDSSSIELDQGLIALLFAVEHEVSMNEALDRFGWTCTFVQAA